MNKDQQTIYNIIKSSKRPIVFGEIRSADPKATEKMSKYEISTAFNWLVRNKHIKFDYDNMGWKNNVQDQEIERSAAN